VRLAQRIPVRIHIDEVPDGVLISSGMTCTVRVEEPPRRSAIGELLRGGETSVESWLSGWTEAGRIEAHR
jgi:hypothetical protein